MVSSKQFDFEKSSAQGSAAAWDKWLVQNKTLIFRKSSAPGSAVALDKWIVQDNMICGKALPQAAQLPRTSGLFKRKYEFWRKFCPRLLDKWFLQKIDRFLRKSSAQGSTAAPDKWLGLEKA